MSNLSVILESMVGIVSPAEMKSAYEHLSHSYRSSTKIVINTPALQLAYLQARMPATVAVLSTVFEALKPHQSSIKTLIDLGSGPGSVLWAACDSLPSLEKATCVDQSAGLLSFGKSILEKSNLSVHADWLKEDLTKLNLSDRFGKADLLTLSYVLNELPQTASLKLLKKAWDKTNGFLVIVEPGTPQAFENLRQFREFLISKDAHILAPCTHENPCPMAGTDWCHFSTRLQRSRTHQSIKGSLPYEDEKFSYIIAAKAPYPRPQSRIIKKPTLSTGLVEMEICNTQGLSCIKISKRQNETYKSARKLNWGDGID